jgi:triosephosphate isomerase
MIFLSLKTYKEATGQAVINLLSSVKKVSQETGIPIISIAQPTDIYRIKNELDIEVWAQHIDPIDPGKNTGWISPYSVKQAGATGIIINHSEHKLKEEVIIATIKKARQYDLKILLIGQTVEMVTRFDSYEIDYLSFEKEDLIASPISMIDQQEEVIKDLVKIIKHPLIIGAGINDGEDTKKTKAVGAVGVLMATYFVTAPDPEQKLRELAQGFL